MKRIKRIFILEWLIIAAIAVVTYTLAGVFDWFETIFQLSRKYEALELDEIIPVCTVLSFCFFVLLFRRWREAIRASRLLDHKNRRLQKALDELKQLKGILPICSNCKKIRDDDGYWHQVETYIQQHSGADFSHGICPECMKELYPEFVDEDGALLDDAG